MNLYTPTTTNDDNDYRDPKGCAQLIVVIIILIICGIIIFNLKQNNIL